MNAVEIEQAISTLAYAEFDREEFPFAFLEAFGNKPTTIKRLREGNGKKSDVMGGVLQRSNIHLAVCDAGKVGETLEALKTSPETGKAKAKFVLATDGTELEAEDLRSGETVACNYPDFANHFGFFLPLAGISTVEQIRNNPIDIQATSRLNKLYVQLLAENEDWATEERRHDMNHFMARLIFCFFAEDTDIFNGSNLFTATVEQMTDRHAKPGKPGSAEYVIGEIFRAMNIKIEDRASAKLPRWADAFPYVNGGLFGGDLDVPRFTHLAARYIAHAGNLDWTAINPDIFGSMIQAVADDKERGSLGMHYTSVPNILKVLNPLFLDDLREQLEQAGNNARKLLNLRKRMAKIRVFDPACGSGNFLVIAYKEMRAIEAEINQRRGEKYHPSVLPLTNYRGIEINDFPAEIARLALIIAEYQCDVMYRGQKEALAVFLPLSAENWITCGNALRLDWLSVCPPTSKSVELVSNDLFDSSLNQAEIDFENEGGETFICGNPPYAGKGKKSEHVLSDMKHVLASLTKSTGYIDLAGCWFVRAAEYLKKNAGVAAFVTTNSVSQGQQLPQLWPLVLNDGVEIDFAHLSFKWSNSALKNAGVICVIIGISNIERRVKKIFDDNNERVVEGINAYLLKGKEIYVNRSPEPLSSDLAEMLTGSVVNDGGNLILDYHQKVDFSKKLTVTNFIQPYKSSQDYIQGNIRYVIAISDENLKKVKDFKEVNDRLRKVKELRLKSKKKETRDVLALTPNKFQHTAKKQINWAIIVPRVSSESRQYLPVGVLPSGVIIADTAFELIDAPLLNMSLIASRIHLVWIATVCGKLKTDFRYSNTLGWNTFPVPDLTEKNKADLTHNAEDILLAREAHFPSTVAELYDPEKMPDNLRKAHERNDEVLERIYIGRRFKNDTERLEKLFELYTKMTAKSAAA